MVYRNPVRLPSWIVTMALLLGGCVPRAPESLTLQVDDETPRPAQPERTYEQIMVERGEGLEAQHRAEEACPPIWFPSRGPLLEGGKTLGLLTDHLNQDGEVRPLTHVNHAFHPLELPGIAFVTAHDLSSACMLGYRHHHCFMSQEGIFCDVKGGLEAFVARHLHIVLEGFSDEDWIQLVATFSGGEAIVPDSATAPQCWFDVPENALAEIRTEVLRTSGSIHVYVTILDGAGTLELHELGINTTNGEVEFRRAPLPEQES